MQRNLESISRALPHSRRALSGLAGSLLLSIAGAAHAEGPALLFEVAPVAESFAGAPGEVRVELHADDVEQLELETAILLATGSEASRQASGVTVLAPDAVDAATRAAPPAGVRIAGAGDALRIPVRHAVSLEPGAYAERVTITALLGRSPIPVEQTRFVYFSIDATGVSQPISSAEYSARSQRFSTGPGGARMLAGAAVVSPEAARQPRLNAVRSSL